MVHGDWSWGNTTQFLVASGTYVYYHNADGTGSCTLSGSWNTGLSSSSVIGSSMSVSSTISLPTIPRASTPSVSGTFSFGSAGTINIARASTSFTHTVEYTFGSATGTIGTGVATSISWTPALTLASQIPNASTGTGTITCKTYSGNTLIGTKTCTFTVTLPSSYVPSFSSITATRVDNGVPTSWGIYIKTKSKCTLAINGASGIYGSTIKSYSISGGGYSTTSSSFTTGTLNTAGTNTFTAKITDSRGRSATKTVSITVVDYTAPVINTTSSQRCNSSGTVADEGTYIRVLGTRTFASCSGKNTATLTVAYKKSTATSYGTTTPLTSGTASVIGAGVIDVNSTYDVRYTLTDTFGTVVKYEQVGTSFNTMDFLAGGKGIAFGKASETANMFECDFDTKFNKTVEIKMTRSKIKLTTTIAQNTNYTIPFSYTVGKSNLIVLYEGELLIKNEHYVEVGTTGQSSTTIQLKDWQGDVRRNFGVHKERRIKMSTPKIKTLNQEKVNKKLVSFSGNADTIKETGFTYLSGTSPNSPKLGYSFWLTTLSLNSNYVYQKAVRVTSNAKTIEEYERQCYNGTWTTWEKVPKSGEAGNDITYEIQEATSTIMSLKMNNLELGGIYDIALSFNNNVGGSPNYRSIINATLSIPCGYNGTSVVVRPKLDNIINYYGTSFGKDPILKVVCEGGGTEVLATSFISNPVAYLYITNSTNKGNFKVAIRRKI